MMAQRSSADYIPNQSLAAGIGVIAGMLTLLLVVAVFRPAGNETETTGSVDPLELAAGTCFQLGPAQGGDLATVDCDLAHDGEFVGTIPFEVEGTDGAYPGSAALSGWAKENCPSSYRTYIGDDLYKTSLDGEAFYPSPTNWESGQRQVNCYLTSLDGSPLLGTVADNAAKYPRGNRVVVTRLLAGDCYRAEDGSDPTLLDSRSAVTITRCDEPHNGVFFGRSRLNFPTDAPFPTESLMTDSTKEACANLFELHFAESVLGFNFRYWRPSEASWNNGDRTVLCTILSAESMDEPFVPSAYVPMVDTETGACFVFGPEEVAETLGRDDKVLVVDCEQAHFGQKVGGGALQAAAESPFPGPDEVDLTAQTLCGAEVKPGIEPTPQVWPPNEEHWRAADFRYLCAVVSDTGLEGTVL